MRAFPIAIKEGPEILINQLLGGIAIIKLVATLSAAIIQA